MKTIVTKNPKELGRAAGEAGAIAIRKAIGLQGFANIILATGTSQFETLSHVIADNEIDWSKITMFHLDEYIGLPITHPASFRKYLQERFLSHVPALKAVHLINGEGDVDLICRQLSLDITAHPIDVAFVGIGENGHLAFNDPPANFDTADPYIVVQLDEACRQQQLGEGWFKNMDEVPQRAISMSIKQILKSKQIICSVPDKRKARAVRDCVEQPLSNLFPATALKLHPNCICFLDEASASFLVNCK
jgi:glucosamine-6-phosphate deaminase